MIYWHTGYLTTRVMVYWSSSQIIFQALTSSCPRTLSSPAPGRLLTSSGNGFIILIMAASDWSQCHTLVLSLAELRHGPGNGLICGLLSDVRMSKWLRLRHSLIWLRHRILIKSPIYLLCTYNLSRTGVPENLIQNPNPGCIPLFKLLSRFNWQAQGQVPVQSQGPKRERGIWPLG